MSIVLTPEQQKALAAEQGITTVIDPSSNATYVLLPKEVFERVRALLDDEFNSEDAFQAQVESAAAAGWDDPGLDVYNDRDPRRPSRW